MESIAKGEFYSPFSLPVYLVSLNTMKRILGIDPGSRFTGYGIIEVTAGRSIWLNSGFIRVQGANLAEKLCVISESLNILLDEYLPDEMAIEKVFLSHNVDSALKLGQARGAAISTVALRKIPVYEYTPTQIKKAVVGKGNAAKTQVQHMMVNLLGLSATPQEDAADALAIALCHAHTGQTLANRVEVLTKTSAVKKRSVS